MGGCPSESTCIAGLLYLPWSVHGACTDHSVHSSTHQLLNSPRLLIHPCWTATRHTLRSMCLPPYSLPHVQAHSQCVAVTPYASHTVLTNLGPSRHVSAPPAHLDHPASGMFRTPPARTFRPHHHVLGSTDAHPMHPHPMDTPHSMCVHIHVHVTPNNVPQRHPTQQAPPRHMSSPTTHLAALLTCQDAIQLMADALEVPLLQRVITGTAVQQGSKYGSQRTLETLRVEGDETEDLFRIAFQSQGQFPHAICVSHD